jgi:L-alanine-DL-glutamate epimerase-like enolase superfamily enzyme
MRITHIEAIPVGLPLAKPLIMAGRRYERSESMLVRLTCDQAIEGWGEAAPYAAHGEQLSTLVTEVRDSVVPIAAGQRLADRAHILTRLWQEAECSPRTIAAVEIAFADALARASGLQIADLYGGARRHSFAQKWLIGAPRMDDELAEVERRTAEGVLFFMLKVGSKPLEQDVLLAQRLRGKFGDRIRLCADANGAWTRAQAMSYLTQLHDIGLVYLEQPLPTGELRDAAALAAAVTTPLSLDEGVASAHDVLTAWQANATSGAVIKPSKYGGLARAMEAGFLCDVLKLKVGLATPVAESSIGTAAALQLGAVLPQVEWEIAPSSDYLADDLVEAPIRHTAGRLQIPAGPGLGVEIDRRQVDRFRLDR